MPNIRTDMRTQRSDPRYSWIIQIKDICQPLQWLANTYKIYIYCHCLPFSKSSIVRKESREACFSKDWQKRRSTLWTGKVQCFDQVWSLCRGERRRAPRLSQTFPWSGSKAAAVQCPAKQKPFRDNTMYLHRFSGFFDQYHHSLTKCCIYRVFFNWYPP